MKAMEKIEMSSHGPHQLALRPRSVNVLDGAMKVSTMRAPSESLGVSGTGAGVCDEVGRTGAVAISASWDVRGNSNPGRTGRQARTAGQANRQLTIVRFGWHALDGGASTGILRLRGCTASRRNHFAQDDMGAGQLAGHIWGAGSLRARLWRCRQAGGAPAPHSCLHTRASTLGADKMVGVANATPIVIAVLAAELVPAAAFAFGGERLGEAIGRWPTAVRVGLPVVLVLPYVVLAVAAHI